MKQSSLLNHSNEPNSVINRYYLDLENLLRSIIIDDWKLLITDIKNFIPKQRVNFFLKGTYNNKVVLIKFSLGGRSILFGFEQWQEDKHVFLGKMREYILQSNDQDTLRECETLDMYKLSGIPSAEVIFSRGPIIIIEYLPGLDLGELYSNKASMEFLPDYAKKVAEILLSISKIPKDSYSSSQITFLEDGSSISLPNFHQPIQLNKKEHSMALHFFPKGSHQIHTIHTDFKPHNLIITPNGDIRVIDGKSSVGPIEFDFGKFIIRSFIIMIDSGDDEMWKKYEEFLYIFHDTFVAQNGNLDDDDFLKKSLLLGCIEARRIGLSSERYGEKEILGSENDLVRKGIPLVNDILEQILQNKPVTFPLLIERLKSGDYGQ